MTADQAFAQAATARSVYWHSNAPPRPDPAPLPVSAHFDVVVVGGGFLGLWAAYHLVRRRQARVLVLEQARVGDGPSGRNAGFLNPQISLSIGQLARLHGEQIVSEATQGARAAVYRLLETIAQERIECELQETGEIIVATNDAQERKLRRDAETYRRLGVPVELIEQHALQESIRSPKFRLGLDDPDVAIVHPTKLVRGLAGVCEGLGVLVCEEVMFESLRRSGSRMRLETSEGDVSADAVVFAINAWSGRQRAFRRLVIPMYTHVIATEPIADGVWAEIGWAKREAISDRRGYLNYYRRTLDGRIVWGGGDAAQPYGSAVAPRYESNPGVFRNLRKSLYSTFPQISDHPVSHEWGGPVDVTAGTFPMFGQLDSRNVFYGYGFAGHGVCLSFLGGETIAALIGGERARTPELFLRTNTKRFPIEPVRYLAGRLARYEIRRLDRIGDGGSCEVREPLIPRLAHRLARFR